MTRATFGVRVAPRGSLWPPAGDWSGQLCRWLLLPEQISRVPPAAGTPSPLLALWGMA